MTTTSRIGRTRKRQRGVAIVWFMISLTALLGLAAMTVDVGLWYHEKAIAKMAADSAALAGAWCESGAACQWTSGTTITAYQLASDYASVNGASMPSSTDLTPDYKGNGNWVNAVVEVPMHTVFAGIFGLDTSGEYITASATADYIGGDLKFYNSSNGLGVSSAYNYSVFGPMAYHDYGDEWSVKYLDSGTVNANYQASGYKGYYFDLDINSNYVSKYGSKFQVELFDPSCYDSGSGQQIDEIRTQNTAITSYTEATDITTTWFTVQYQNSTTGGQWLTATSTNSSAPAQVAYTGQSYAHLQWVDDPNMEIDTSSYPSDTTFRVNATSTDPNITDPWNVNMDGSSENGFNLRAGPPEPSKDIQTPSGDSDNGGTQVNIVSMGQTAAALQTTTGQAAEESAWASAYNTDGIGIAADGNMQLNINNANNNSSTTTAVPLDFGAIPATVDGVNVLGGTFTVTRFDTDVGATALTYEDAGSTPANLQIANGGIKNSDNDDTVYQDTFTVNTAGEITGTYTGGSSDTSDWSAAYAGFPGQIALVGESGLSY